MINKIIIGVFLFIALFVAGLSVHLWMSNLAVSDSQCWSVDSSIGELLDHKETNAVLMKYVPGVFGDPKIKSARGISPRQIKRFSADFTDDILLELDAELMKIPYGSQAHKE